MITKSPAEGWIDATARRAHVNSFDVRAILARYDFHPPGVAARPHKLRLVQIHFAGVKPAGHARSAPEPFTFTWNLRPGVNAVATYGENEAGKSTVLEVARWALRGRCGLQDDTRIWIRQVLLEVQIDDERLVIVFSVTDGRPDGHIFRIFSTGSQERPTFDPDESALIAMSEIISGVDAYAPAIEEAVQKVAQGNGVAIAHFRGHDEFERTAGGLMLDRLGFDRLTGWQSLPAHLASIPGEGVPSKLDWTTWSNVLAVSGLNVLLGNNVEHSVRLLQIYLGTSWAGTAVDLKTVVRKEEQQAAATKRRIDADREELQAHINRLVAEVNSLEDQLLTLQAMFPSVKTLEAHLRELEEAIHAQSDAATRLMQAQANLDEINSALLGAEADLLAVTEAAISRRFFHSVTPTCCPRCDSVLSLERFQREAEGQCSLCSEPIELHDIPAPRPDTDRRSWQPSPGMVEEAPDEPSPTDEATEIRRDIDAMIVQRTQARLTLQEAKSQEEEVAGRIARAKARIDEADSSISTARRIRTIELDLAGKHAVLQDYKSRLTPAIEDASSNNVGEIVIIKAALKEAEDRRNAEQEGLLTAVSERIYELARSFGLDELESTRLTGGVQLALRKGGENTSYSKCTSGEKLRLKVATIVALLQVGRRTGVGRHPGLLLIDSVGAEEMGDVDLKSMLRSLRELADEGPQLIIASARATTLSEVLPSEAMRVAPAGEKIW